MGNTISLPYDKPSGFYDLPHEYFVKRNQADIHYAYKWHVYKVQNSNLFHSEKPNDYLITNKAEELYELYKDTDEFVKFIKWMGRIPV